MNGVDQGHINGIRVPTYDGVRLLSCTLKNFSYRPFLQPITDVTSNGEYASAAIKMLHVGPF